MSNLVLITGNTFPVKEHLKALGGRWNAASKGWMVPEARAEEARAIVAGAGAPARAVRVSPRTNAYGRRACVTGGNCSSFGTGRDCGGYDCDGY